MHEHGCTNIQGIKELSEHNIFEDFLPGDLKVETDAEAAMWKNLMITRGGTSVLKGSHDV
jgi:hypothetical protein